MGLNFGSSTGGVSNPSAFNNQVIYNMPVNFGKGGINQKDIYTGNIGNEQTS